MQQSSGQSCRSFGILPIKRRLDRSTLISYRSLKFGMLPKHSTCLHPGTGYLPRAVGQRQRHPREYIPALIPSENQ